jgi:hypothetical protein
LPLLRGALSTTWRRWRLTDLLDLLAEVVAFSADTCQAEQEGQR